jgi:hypothetical protein
MDRLVSKIGCGILAIVVVCAVSQAGAEAQDAGPQNTNPNVALVHEYGRIEWHGNTAELIAGTGLGMAALTLSTCLSISVSAESPHYRWLGDLLDVTAPQWAVQHPDRHVYAAKPSRVAVSFAVGDDGQPVDTTKLLEDAVNQVNQQLPWRYRLAYDVPQGHSFYTFVPTATHNESGQLEQVSSWLDDPITISPTMTHVGKIANILAEALTADTGYHFHCCQGFVAGIPWGGQTIHYEATDQRGRFILEDLMLAAATPWMNDMSYQQSCEPMDKEWCFIEVEPTVNRIPATAPQSGVCTVLGFDAD